MNTERARVSPVTFRTVEKRVWRLKCVVVGAAVLLSVVCCLLFAVCCLLAVVSCLLSVVCCLLFADCCLLSVVCCLLSAVCCLLSAVCCLLSAVCCLLFAVRCLLSVVNFCYLFTICSLFVHPLYTFISQFVRSLFIVCLLSSTVCQLYACSSRPQN